MKTSAREYGKRREEELREKERRLQAGEGRDPQGGGEAVNPEMPKLVNQALFGKTLEERQMAKDRLEELKKEATCQK